MLNIFRKYQKSIYLFVTVIIVISFSFFGTYGTFGSNRWREDIIVTSVNGSEISHHEIDQFNNFISSDAHDKLMLGGALGPNFLNDGVIKKDFLETGLAKLLMQAYKSDLESYFAEKLDREKKYQLYKHPQASFIGVEQTWSYFAPSMQENFKKMQDVEDAEDILSDKALEARINLYLSEKEIPAHTLKRILQYQEQQFDWVVSDQKIDNLDLSLFGYHSVSDWFSPAFTSLVSQFIISSAEIAEKNGYHITPAEAMSDLIKNAQVSFAENSKSPLISADNAQEYFNQQLQVMGIDVDTAVEIWQKVMLFRRYFADFGQAVFVDAVPQREFQQFSSQKALLKNYTLPRELQLTNLEELKDFEIYLAAISGKSPEENVLLPHKLLSAKEVSDNYPSLEKSSFEVELSKVSVKNLQRKISIKDIWTAETEDSMWQELREKFPEIGKQKAENKKERLKVLDNLNRSVRVRVDNIVRQRIIQANPKWIEEALNIAPVSKQEIQFVNDSSVPTLDGVAGKAAKLKLKKLLENSSDIDSYTPDEQNYYRIKVLKKPENKAVLTFAEAKAKKVMPNLKKAVLKNFYQQLQAQGNSDFKNDQGKWLPFEEIEKELATKYFAFTLQLIQDQKEALKPSYPHLANLSQDQLVQLRFYPYIQQVQDALATNYTQGVAEFVRDEEKKDNDNSLEDQWKLTASDLTVSRKNRGKLLAVDDLFTKDVGHWMEPTVDLTGKLSFMQLINFEPATEKSLQTEVLKMQNMLAETAEQYLMKKVLAEIESAKAINLNYLTKE